MSTQNTVETYMDWMDDVIDSSLLQACETFTHCVSLCIAIRIALWLGVSLQPYSIMPIVVFNENDLRCRRPTASRRLSVSELLCSCCTGRLSHPSSREISRSSERTVSVGTALKQILHPYSHGFFVIGRCDALTN